MSAFARSHRFGRDMPRAKKSAIEVFDGLYDPSLIVLRHAGGRKLSLESCGMIADAIRFTLILQRYIS